MQKRSQKKSTSSRTSRPARSNMESSENALQELFLDELADIYSAEQQITKALPKMAQAAESDELREAFEMHLDETENQLERLEQVAETMDETIKRKTCKGMKGLLEDGQEMMREKKNSPALDAALIASAQKVEHYEIAAYGTLCAYAKQLDRQDALDLLQETLEEEKVTDEKLTGIAENIANTRAEEEMD